MLYIHPKINSYGSMMIKKHQLELQGLSSWKQTTSSTNAEEKWPSQRKEGQAIQEGRVLIKGISSISEVLMAVQIASNRNISLYVKID